MSSRRLFWLSTLHLFSTALLMLGGVFCLLLFFFPGVRFDLADLLNENRFSLFVFGSFVLAVGALLFAVFLWLSRVKFVQVKLGNGQMGLGKDLIEKTVTEFWQERFKSVPNVAVDKPDQIEILCDLKSEELKVVESEISQYLQNKIGCAPKIVLSLCKNY